MRSNNRGFDKALIGIIFILFLIGELLIASATHVIHGASPKRMIVQLMSFILGLISIYLMKFFDYQDFKKYSRKIYILGIASLLLVYTKLGATLGGARGWIKLGPIFFQPIEISKLCFIVVFAKYLEKNAGELNTFKDILKAMVIPAPIIGLLLVQPDLGGAIVFFCIIFGMMFLAKINMKLVNKTAVTLALTFPIIYVYVLDKVLHEYQMNRIKNFFGPKANAAEDNYQVFRSMVAIASGGIFGKGPFKGTQNNLGFISVSDSDFIFAVCGEEYGMLGMFILIGIYFLFLTRLIKIAMSAKDLYGSLIVMGIFSMFTYQFIQNVGMTIGIMPVTGVPLPFVSYGGSSMLMSMISIAFVENIASKRKAINF